MSAPEKVCKICNVSKILNLYEYDPKKNTYRNQCKNCRNQRTIARRNEQAKKNNMHVQQNIDEKMCAHCKSVKSIAHFGKNKYNADGYCYMCKECRSITIKAQKQQRQNKIAGKEKVCSRCNLLLPSVNFFINMKATDNLSPFCVSCARPNNWTIEKQRESYKKYDKNNVKYRKEQAALPHNKVKKSIASRVRSALKTQNLLKSSATVEYVGCTIQFLREWLQYQFEDDMCWDNIGKWHIDHVKPCSSFNLQSKDEQKACFNWKNLRPLWGKENMSKSNKLDLDLIQLHKQKADNYEKLFSAQVKGGELLE